MRVWLVEARVKKGLSRKELAAKCGFSYHSIIKYEKGTRCPRPFTAKNIARILDFDWTYFYGDNPSENTQYYN
jgi:putative transcriptional regulator